MSYKDKVDLKIIYAGADISIDIMPYLMAFTYRDKVTGQADELLLQLRDNAHLWKWSWNPKSGDKIEAEIMQGNTRLPCGTFDVTEVNFSGSRDGGHTCTITALSEGVLDHHRNKTSFAHEGATLKQIAEYYAKKYHWKVQGIIHNHSIARVSQFKESDLEFLHRIAEQFGYAMTLKGKTLVFTSMEAMNNAAGIIKVKREELMNYSIRDKTVGIFVRGQNTCYNQKKKKLIENTVESESTKGAATYRTHSKADNDAHGLLMVGGRLYKKNMEETEFDVSMPGNIYMIAGNNVQLEGFFNYNGLYMISEANHNITKDGGYVTSAILKKIIPNKDKGATSHGAKKTGIDTTPDISAEAKTIYDTMEQLIVAVKGMVLNGTLASGYSARINNALLTMRSKGAGDLADEVQQKYSGAIAVAVTGDVTAEDDAREIQSMMKVHMK